MNFIEAVKAMKEGKKVKFNAMTCWIKENGWMCSEFKGETRQLFSQPNLDSNQWKIAEDRRALWEKRHDDTEYHEKDVKQALKEYFESPKGDKERIEIFGERLI